MNKTIVDAMGEQCPVPVIKTMKALDAMTEPGIMEVHVDNRTAVENLSRLADSRKLPVSVKEINEKQFEVSMTVEEITAKSSDSAPSDTAAPEYISCAPAAEARPLVAVIGSDTMGSGNDELGRTLMKGFIYALSQLEKLPDTVIFYNGGAKLSTEGSASLEDLKAMEAQGTKIVTCGTCLNFYGLTEKLAVGSVTNMYDIVETMNSAARIIRP